MIKTTTEMCPICNISLKKENAAVKIHYCGADYIVSTKALSCDECGYQKLIPGNARIDYAQETEKSFAGSDNGIETSENVVSDEDSDDGEDCLPKSQTENRTIENTDQEPVKTKGFLPKSQLLGLAPYELKNTDYEKEDISTETEENPAMDGTNDDEEGVDLPQNSIIVPKVEEYCEKLQDTLLDNSVESEETESTDTKIDHEITETDRAVEKIVEDSVSDAILHEEELKNGNAVTPIMKAAEHSEPDEDVLKHLIMASTVTSSHVKYEKNNEKPLSKGEDQKKHSNPETSVNDPALVRKKEVCPEENTQKNNATVNVQNRKQNEHAGKDKDHSGYKGQNQKNGNLNHDFRTTDKRENNGNKDSRHHEKERPEGKNKRNGDKGQNNQETVHKNKNLVPDTFGASRVPSGFPGSFPKANSQTYMPHHKGMLGYAPYAGKVPTTVNPNGISSSGKTSGDHQDQKKENGDKNVPSHIEENTRDKKESNTVDQKVNDCTANISGNESMQNEEKKHENSLSEKSSEKNPSEEKESTKDAEASDVTAKNVNQNEEQISNNSPKTSDENSDQSSEPDRNTSEQKKEGETVQAEKAKEKTQATPETSSEKNTETSPKEAISSNKNSSAPDAEPDPKSKDTSSNEQDAEANGEEYEEDEEIEKDLMVKITEKMPQGVVKTIKPLSNVIEKRDRRIFMSKERRYLETHIPKKKVIIEGLIYDTQNSNMFLRVNASYGLDRPCVHYNYKTSNGNFFRCTVCYGKEDTIRVLEEYDVKRLLQDYPDLYEEIFPGTIQKA